MNKNSRLFLATIMIAMTAMIGISFDQAFAQVNNPPTVVITSPNEGLEFQPWEKVLMTATASDPEDGSLNHRITWFSNIDGSLGGGNFKNINLSSGSHTLTAQTIDSGGLTATDVVHITVRDFNIAPSLIILSPEAGSEFTEGDSITFSGSASDPEDVIESPSVDTNM